MRRYCDPVELSTWLIKYTRLAFSLAVGDPLLRSARPHSSPTKFPSNVGTSPLAQGHAHGNLRPLRSPHASSGEFTDRGFDGNAW